jgi:hypothetical protein
MRLKGFGRHRISYGAKRSGSMIECMKNMAKRPEFGQWIPVSEKLPDPETEVLITARRKYKSGRCVDTITTALYEDGNISEAIVVGTG